MKTPARLLALLASAAALHAADPIKLGEYASLTGKEAGFGQTSHQGVVLALEEINAAGGVLGRKLELVSEDNQTKPGESATVVKKLISRSRRVARSRPPPSPSRRRSR
jgi:branched-chain amino acid transport system substrate-binding protein